MPYPDEIITALTEKFSLTKLQQEQLRDCLMIDKLRMLIEASEFNPENLIILVDAETIYIPTSKIINQLYPDINAFLIELKEYFARFPIEAREYLQILEEIKQVDTLRLSVSSERLQRKLLLQTISEKVESLYDFLKNNWVLSLEISNVSNILTLHLNSELKWLQREAVTYFRENFLHHGKRILDVSFLPKVDGVQLGHRMLIRYSDSDNVEHCIIFFIKTHQFGSLRDGASTVVPVDPKELFFYKVLEYTGFGPKAHFFFNPLSPSAFFIATQDEGFTKILGKEKFFRTYGLEKERLDALSSGPTLNDQVKLGVARIDILLRIFNLWDITMNPGNYGYVSVDREKEKWRIIDFRVDTQEDYRLESIFEDYRDGKGMDGYLGLPKNVLNEISSEERLRLASDVLKEFELGRPSQSRAERKLPLSDAMGKALDDVHEYITANGKVLRMDLDTVLNDLRRYFEGVNDNLRMFVIGVHECASVSSRCEFN